MHGQLHTPAERAAHVVYDSLHNAVFRSAKAQGLCLCQVRDCVGPSRLLPTFVLPLHPGGRASQPPRSSVEVIPAPVEAPILPPPPIVSIHAPSSSPHVTPVILPAAHPIIHPVAHAPAAPIAAEVPVPKVPVLPLVILDHGNVQIVARLERDVAERLGPVVPAPRVPHHAHVAQLQPGATHRQRLHQHTEYLNIRGRVRKQAFRTAPSPALPVRVYQREVQPAGLPAGLGHHILQQIAQLLQRRVLPADPFSKARKGGGEIEPCHRLELSTDSSVVIEVSAGGSCRGLPGVEV